MPSALDNNDFLPKPKPINPLVAGSFMGREISQVNEPISDNGNKDLDENPYLTVLCLVRLFFLTTPYVFLINNNFVCLINNRKWKHETRCTSLRIKPVKLEGVN